MLNIAVERRLYTRTDIELPVKIFYGELCIATCTTVNIGMGGMLIETTETGLTVNSLIQIMFDVDPSHCLYNVKIPAIVSRNEPDKVAVSFERLEKGIEEFICRS